MANTTRYELHQAQANVQTLNCIRSAGSVEEIQWLLDLTGAHNAPGLETLGASALRNIERDLRHGASLDDIRGLFGADEDGLIGEMELTAPTCDADLDAVPAPLRREPGQRGWGVVDDEDGE